MGVKKKKNPNSALWAKEFLFFFGGYKKSVLISLVSFGDI